MVKRPYILVLIFLVVFGLVSCQDSAVDSINDLDDDSPIAGDALDQLADDTPDDPSSDLPPDGTTDDPSSELGLSPGLIDEAPHVANKTKKHKKQPAAAVQTCEQLLVDTKAECLRTVPAGYDPAGCVFSWLENDDCDWEFVCTAVLTESPPTTTTTESASSSSSAESCETDRKISFSNCFINVDGFVKHSRAQLCN